MERRARPDQISRGSAAKELKTPAQIQKEKKKREIKKVKQNKYLRKQKKHEAKERRIERLEERQTKYGARTKAKMLIIPAGPKTWHKAKARPRTGHGPKGTFGL